LMPRHDPNLDVRAQEDKTPSLEYLLNNLDLSFLWSKVRSKYSLHGWVSTFDCNAMFKALLLKEIRRLSSKRKLASFLKKDRRWLRICGFDKPPHHDSFSEFIDRIGVGAFREVFNEMVRQLNDVENIGRIVAIDSTLFEAYSKDSKSKANADPDARWGYSATTKTFVFGYKLHVACDAESELPLTYTLTPANVYDSVEYLNLLKDLTARGIKPKVVLADAGYDSVANIRQTFERYGATPIIAMNKRNSKDRFRKYEFDLPVDRESDEWKNLYRQRGAVERLFSRLKEEMDFKAVKVRGHESVEIHAALSLITMLSVALVAKKTGNSDLSTSLNFWRF